MDGAKTVRIGPVLSTIKVVLEPADVERFPNASEAVPLARDIPKVPFPEIPEAYIISFRNCNDALQIRYLS